MRPTMDENNRKAYFIKREFQFKFIFKFCIILLLGVILSTVILWLFSRNTLTTSFQESRLVVENTSVAILPSVIYTNLITMGVIILVTIFVMLLLSHKIAGPLARFENEINAIGNGDFTRVVRLRGNDQITEIADSLNNMVTNIHQKLEDIHSRVEQLKAVAEKENYPEHIVEQINQLQQKINTNFKI